MSVAALVTTVVAINAATGALDTAQDTTVFDSLTECQHSQTIAVDVAEFFGYDQVNISKDTKTVVLVNEDLEVLLGLECELNGMAAKRIPSSVPMVEIDQEYTIQPVPEKLRVPLTPLAS